jgi:hypothetical protein
VCIYVCMGECVCVCVCKGGVCGLCWPPFCHILTVVVSCLAVHAYAYILSANPSLCCIQTTPVLTANFFALPSLPGCMSELTLPPVPPSLCKLPLHLFCTRCHCTTCASASACVCACVWVRACACACACTCACACVWVLACACVWVCAHDHI